MAVTAAQIAEVRRMVNEPTAEVYSDDLLAAIIGKHPMTDERGVDPYYWNTGVIPPVKTVNPGWIETYNLNLAAADVWHEKAAAIANQYDFSADGGSYSRSQAYQQALGMAKFYRGKSGISVITLIKSPDEPSVSVSNRPWIGNLPEERDD